MPDEHRHQFACALRNLLPCPAKSQFIAHGFRRHGKNGRFLQDSRRSRALNFSANSLSFRQPVLLRRAVEQIPQRILDILRIASLINHAQRDQRLRVKERHVKAVSLVQWRRKAWNVQRDHIFHICRPQPIARCQTTRRE